MIKAIVTGANGMLGTAVAEYLHAAGDEVKAFGRSDLDITDAHLVQEMVRLYGVNVVVNCAAWTDVDACESNHERNFGVHADGPENLATACRNTGASLVTISTDYVFDGEKDGFYTQRDNPNPISEYGRAKLAGERRAQAALARTMIVRVGWLFGAGGGNFLSKVPELLGSGQKINAIADSYGTPTYAPHLAKRIRELILLDLPGVYHVANGGEGVSYAGFARAIDATGWLINDVMASSLKRLAPRPENSRLRCVTSEILGLEALPNWEDALSDFLSHTAAPYDGKDRSIDPSKLCR